MVDVGFRYSKWFIDGYDQQQFQALEALQENADYKDRSLAALSASHGKLVSQVELLSAAVTTLIRRLAEVSNTDTETIVTEIEAEMETARAAREADAARVRTTVTCTRCKREVDPRRTVMTGDGAICDPGCA